MSARERFGPLPVSTHLVYSPSPLLGAPAVLDNVMPLDAVTAMIIQGDLARQLEHAPPGGRLSRVEPYQDGEGRMRLQLLWD